MVPILPPINWLSISLKVVGPSGLCRVGEPLQVTLDNLQQKGLADEQNIVFVKLIIANTALPHGTEIDKIF